jgi:hypothetical protein
MLVASVRDPKERFIGIAVPRRRGRFEPGFLLQQILRAINVCDHGKSLKAAVS